MNRYLLRRLGASLFLVYVILTLTFFLIHLAPGDPARLFSDPRFPREYRQHLIAAYGLDQPLPVQYVRWLSAVALHGDWGTSFAYQRSVARVVAEALPRTLALGGAALVIEYSAALVLGLAAARRSGSRADHLIRIASLAVFAVPTFWLGMMALLLFGYVWPVLPLGEAHSVGYDELSRAGKALDFGRHLLLPALVLGLSAAGGTARFVRTSMLQVLSQDYIRTARAKGLSERRVLWVHGLRNALVPMTQLLALSIPILFNGSLVTEVVFSWPGLGRVTFAAILSRDYPILIATTALTATLVILANLLADLLQGVVDPRVRIPGA